MGRRRKALPESVSEMTLHSSGATDIPTHLLLFFGHLKPTWSPGLSFHGVTVGQSLVNANVEDYDYWSQSLWVSEAAVVSSQREEPWVSPGGRKENTQPVPSNCRSQQQGPVTAATG